MKKWQSYKITDFLEINPSLKLNAKNKYSFVEMKDLSESKKYVNPSQKKGLKGGDKFQEKDTLFARITPCLENGKICQVKNLEEGVGFGSTEFLVFRGKQGISDTDFVYYLSRSEVFRNFAEQNMVGTSGRQRVSKEVFSNLELDLPDLPTQKAIAEILSSLDDKIELNNQINQNLEALAQALFKQWFVDFEFPNENGEPYKSSGGEMIDSELGEIPKGWELESLENFGEVICGKTPSKAEPENFGNEVPFIKIPDMHGKIFITETIESLSIKGANSQKKKLLPQGSVMISSIATVGLVALTTRNSQTNQQINSIIPKHAFQTYFLYFLCLELKPTFLNLASGGAVTLNMNTSTFKSLKVIHPKSDILESFHKRVETIFEQILNLQIESENLSNLRDTLLPKLISGELEVNESLLEPTF